MTAGAHLEVAVPKQSHREPLIYEIGHKDILHIKSESALFTEYVTHTRTSSLAVVSNLKKNAKIGSKTLNKQTNKLNKSSQNNIGATTNPIVQN